MDLRDVQVMNHAVQACKGKECKFTDTVENREFVGHVDNIYVSHNEEADEVRVWVSGIDSMTKDPSLMVFNLPEDVWFCLSSNRSIVFRSSTFKILLEIEL